MRNSLPTILRTRRAGVFLVAAVLAVACGKKGVPLPPVPERPAPVADLAVRQEGNLAVLVWTPPDRTTSGRAIPPVEKVEIWRSEGPLGPLPPAPAASAAPAAPAVSPFEAPSGAPNPESAGARTSVVDPRRADFLASRVLVETIEGATLGRSTRGPRFVWSEIVAEALRQRERPRRRLTYGVVVFAGGGSSELSNLAIVDPRPIQSAPLVGEVRVGENHVRLALLPRDPDPALHDVESPRGSVVFRRRAGEAEALEPAGPPVIDPEIAFDDRGVAEGCYFYRAAALLGSDGCRGPRGDEFVVEVVDRFPPPPPRAPEIFREEVRINLFWDPVAAPDLVAWRIERASSCDLPDERWVAVASIPAEPAKWSDLNVRPDDRFCYRIRSVDRAGNTSGPSPASAAPAF